MRKAEALEALAQARADLAEARQAHLADREAWAQAAAAERQESRELIDSLVAQLGALAHGPVVEFPRAVAGAMPYRLEDDDIDEERQAVVERIDAELRARGLDPADPLIAT